VFWIAAERPNGATSVSFTAIGAILFAPRADQVYTAASGLTPGAMLTTVAAS
jgi:hypothetical protein